MCVGRNVLETSGSSRDRNLFVPAQGCQKFNGAMGVASQGPTPSRLHFDSNSRDQIRRNLPASLMEGGLGHTAIITNDLARNNRLWQDGRRSAYGIAVLLSLDHLEI